MHPSITYLINLAKIVKIAAITNLFSLITNTQCAFKRDNDLFLQACSVYAVQ